MKLNTETANNSALAQMTPGVYEARVVKIVELGSQKPHPDYSRDDKGNLKPAQKMLAMTFEIPDETVEINGEQVPRIVFKTMSVSLGERAHLSKIVASSGISGEFETTDLLGVAVTITMGHNQRKTKVVPTGFAPMSARAAVAVPEAKTVFSSFEFDNPNMDAFDALPDFQKDQIRGATNFSGSKVEAMLLNDSGNAADDVEAF